MKFKQTPLVILSLFLSFQLLAQSNPGSQTTVDIGFCGHQHVMNMAAQDPAWNQLQQQIEKNIYQHFQEKPDGSKSLLAPAIYTLPVVVHIIHDNGPENISDAVVLQGIQDLNDAYANVGYYNPSTGVDTEIQFCLALRDPDGNPSTGINRVETPLTEMVLEDDDITVKDLSRWDPLNYINIWLVREICSSGYGCGVAGYAYFPTSHGQPEDGIMMEAEFFGSTQGNSGVQVHEMGHYLGLYHTFQGGCPNNDCLTDGDRVCDTPPDGSTAAVPCGGSVNTCSTDANSGFPDDQNDIFEDYMDYGDFNCWSVFTQGQSDRMHWHIENVRFSLLGSQGCMDPCLSPPTAQFGSSINTLDVGGQVDFSNASSNETSYGWEIDGISFASTADASYVFNSVGTFEICLNVGNDDPNCSDVYCENITVTCPVQPEFTTDVFYPNPGQVVNYTNSSSNATDYSWELNGTQIATSANLQYTYTGQGINELCLVANNGLCDAAFCLPVFVTEGVLSDCDQKPFVRTFGEPGVDEEGLLIIPSGDGNLYMGGSSGSKSLIIKMNIDGEPIWQRSFQFTTKNDILTELIVDSDGLIVGGGFGEQSGNIILDAFAFRYDPIGNAVIWSKQYSGGSRMYSIIEPSPGSDFILVQDLRDSPSPGAFEDGVLREVDRNTGDMTGNLQSNYNIGSSETFSSTVLHNGELYTTGRYTNGAGTVNMRMGLSRFDLTGNEIWTRFSHVSTAASARLYGRDLLIENDEIITITSGDDNGSSATATNFFLQNNDLDGNINWVRKYDIGAFGNEWAEEIISVSDGFIIMGLNRTVDEKIFLVKTDKDGNPLWARSYGDNDQGIRFTSQSQIISAGDFLYFTGWMTDSGNTLDALLVKTDSNGELIDNCILTEELKINMFNISNPANAVFSLNEYGNTQGVFTGSTGPELASLPYFDVPGCVCVPEIECDTTFLKSYGTPEDDEYSHAIAIVPSSMGGGFLLGGGKADSAMITWVDQVGDIIWTRSFDATFDAADFVWDISFDSDNMVIGVGQTRDEPLDNVECLAFRYDMTANVMLWINELDLFDPAQEQYYSIVEEFPGGDFIVAGKIDQLGSGTTGCDGVIVKIDRNTGSNVWQNNYTLGDCELFRRIIIHSGSIYATGGYNFDAFGESRIRPGITQFDLSGNQLWSKLYLEPTTASDNASLYSMDLVEDNGLVVFGFGDDTGTSTTDNILFLYKTDLSGNLNWSQRYDIPGASSERAARIINLPDGYVMLGFLDNGSKDAFIFKTDKLGNVEWSKTFGTTDGEEEAWDIVWESGQLFFTGKTTGLGAGTSEDMYLINLNADGTSNAQDSCNLFVDIDMEEGAWDDPYESIVSLTNLNQTWGFFLDFAQMGETSVQSTVSCFNPCIDSCDLVPEAQLVNAQAVCQSVDLMLSLEVCNDGNFELPAGTPITIYDADPTVVNANVVTTVLSPEGIGNNECKTFDFLIDADINTGDYVVVNDDGTTPTPFDLSNFDALEEECDYTNNVGAFQVDFMSPPLELGPDVFTCEFGVVELDAGPDFETYEWNDGGVMQTTTAWLPGTYWVIVTDACGFVQSDTISILVDSTDMVDLGPDQALCLGQSYTFDVEGFTTYEWLPSDYLDCTDCPNPTTTPEADITYTLTATTDDGCVSVDTISFTILPQFETSEDLEICEGQSVIIFGEEVSTAGTYMETFEASNGCDSVHTVNLDVLDVVFTSEDIFVCFGEEVDIFGEPTSTSGVYEMTFEASNGCDSTHTITLEVNPELFLEFDVTNNLCFGESNASITALPSGGTPGYDYEWEDGSMDPSRINLPAGVYGVTVTDSTGCSISSEVTLQDPPLLEASVLTQDVSCDELGRVSASGTGGTGDYTYLWNTLDETANVTDLEAGTYTVTITDENGCTAIESVEITGALAQEVSITILQDLTIANPEGGELQVDIDGGTGPYDIEWNNGETTNIIDSLGAGEYIVVVTDDNGCIASDTVYLFLPACTGGEVWNDINRDGCDDAGEQGISGVVLTLSGNDIWGNPVNGTTTTAFDGSYQFDDLPPGDYVINIEIPAGYLLSDMDACSNDYSDSDFNTSGNSPTLSLAAGDCDLITDAGLYDDCINVTHPGEICCDQVLCGPGNDPDPILSISPATGGSPIEYTWMYSFFGGDQNNGTWVAIPGTNSLTYDPGPLQVTTFFVRCARVEGCETWLEGDYVTITVDNEMAAQIIEPEGAICIGAGVTFAAVQVAGATYLWEFGGNASPPTANTQFVNVAWAEAGYPAVTLTVITDECTSGTSTQIAVSDDPNYCNSTLESEGPETLQWRDGAVLITDSYSLYPNPTDGQLYIRWDGTSGNPLIIQLYGIDGRMIQTDQVASEFGLFETNLESLPPGMYTVRILRGNENASVFRVIKE